MIENEIQYRSALERIEDLLKVVNDETPQEDADVVEVDRMIDLVENYERAHFPIGREKLEKGNV